MQKMNRRQQLAQLTPEVPERFHQAMCGTLEGIVASEHNPQKGWNLLPATRRAPRLRRALLLALVLALLLATVAIAAYHWQIFEALRPITGAAPRTADALMQADLARTTVNGVDIALQEAGYDGKTLFLQYTYRMNDVLTPLGVFRDGQTEEGLSTAEWQLLTDRGVGWWTDHIWINGQCVDMPNNSGSVASGSATPGEIVQTEYWRLDNVGLQLSGKVQVALPIGERQPASEYVRATHPEKYDEQGRMKQPEQGVVVFTVDTADALSQVRTEHPNLPVRTTDFTAQVSEVCYSPLMTYITLSLTADPAAAAAYRAAHGDGFYSEDGSTMLWAYGDTEVYLDWVNSLALVDGEGKVLIPESIGYNGCGNGWAEFVYPHLESRSGPLYLAPVEDGIAEMVNALTVR